MVFKNNRKNSNLFSKVLLSILGSKMKNDGERWENGLDPILGSFTDLNVLKSTYFNYIKDINYLISEYHRYLFTFWGLIFWDLS